MRGIFGRKVPLAGGSGGGGIFGLKNGKLLIVGVGGRGKGPGGDGNLGGAVVSLLLVVGGGCVDLLREGVGLPNEGLVL